MKRLLPTLCVLLEAVSAFGQFTLASGSLGQVTVTAASAPVGLDETVPPTNTPVRIPSTVGFANPISPPEWPGTGSLFGERMLWEGTNVWMICANTTNGFALLRSSTPFYGHTNWSFVTNITILGSYLGAGSATAPDLVKHGGYYYLFGCSNVTAKAICTFRATEITGPYVNLGAAVTYSATTNLWNSYRVLEPCVFYATNISKWTMLYMGDLGSNIEQIGAAYSDSIEGPWVENPDNPVMPLGDPGAYDGMTVADPTDYTWNGITYVAYAVSPTNELPWFTAVATTTNMTNFTKLGVYFTGLYTPSWEANSNAHRSAWLLATNSAGRPKYIFNYNADNFQIGLATLPATKERVWSFGSWVEAVGSSTVENVSVVTDVDANCGISYGIAAGTYTNTVNETSAGSTNHSFQLTGLVDGVTYYYIARATNPIYSDTFTNSAERSFTFSGNYVNLTNGLVAYWKMNEGTASNRWDSWGTNTLYQSNTVNVISGIEGYSAGFPGINTRCLQAMDADNLSAFGGESITLTTWFIVTNTAGSYTVFGKDNLSPVREYTLYVSAANALTFQWFTNAATATSLTDTDISALSATTWYFAAVQLDATNHLGKLRVGKTDGTLYPWRTAAFNGNGTNTAAGLQFGRFGSSTYPLNGAVDEALLWRRAITDAEITNVFHYGRTNTAIPLQ